MGIKQEMQKELTEHILPFWQKLRDEKGGFCGYVSYDLKTDFDADKGTILHSRILWVFSEAYRALGERHLLESAEHAYRFLADACVDKENGGVYWSVTADGCPADTTKHTYAQAFAVYGLSAYYAASGDTQALKLAYALFQLIETKCWSGNGYSEAFDRLWNKAENDKLSENGVEAQRTMNTLLHIFEAYAQLYAVDQNSQVAAAMRRILECFVQRIYAPALHRQEVFFDAQWRSLIDLHSYGHDIEASWLLDWGCNLLEDTDLSARVGKMTADLAENILCRGLHENRVFNECENGVDDKTQVWWVQAEAVIGFTNMWQKTGDSAYLKIVRKIWAHIQQTVVDPRPGSEWFWSLDDKGAPNKKPIVEPWKCPYHNGRMCLEMMRRLPNDV